MDKPPRNYQVRIEAKDGRAIVQVADYMTGELLAISQSLSLESFKYDSTTWRLWINCEAPNGE